MANGAATAPLSLTVRLVVGPPAPFAQEDVALPSPVAALGRERAGDDLYATLLALPGAGALLHPAALSAVARRLLALAGALSPGADAGVLSRAMEELERLAAGGTAVNRVAETSASVSTAADMDIDPAAGGSNQLGGAGAARGGKRKREARRTGGDDDDAPGVSQRPAKRRILAWRARRYRSLVAKAKATARRARSRRAQARPRRGKTGGWKSVQRQLARATLSDGLHRWSPGGGGPAEH